MSRKFRPLVSSKYVDRSESVFGDECMSQITNAVSLSASRNSGNFQYRSYDRRQKQNEQSRMIDTSEDALRKYFEEKLRHQKNIMATSFRRNYGNETFLKVGYKYRRNTDKSENLYESFNGSGHPLTRKAQLSRSQNPMDAPLIIHSSSAAKEKSLAKAYGLSKSLFINQRFDNHRRRESTFNGLDDVIIELDDEGENIYQKKEILTKYIRKEKKFISRIKRDSDYKLKTVRKDIKAFNSFTEEKKNPSFMSPRIAIPTERFDSSQYMDHTTAYQKTNEDGKDAVDRI